MSASLIVPLVAISYLILVAWYSSYMAEALNTQYVYLVVVGLLFPPIWIILLLATFVYRLRGKEVAPRKIKVVKSPKRKEKLNLKSKKI